MNMPAGLRARLIRGVGATAIGQIVNAVIQLVSVPAFLAIWGVTQYGEWLILGSLAAFLSMSDVGFATAAANEMTMRVGRGDKDGAVVVYHSMWALLSALGLAVLMLVFAILWLTPVIEWVPLTSTSSREAAAVLCALAVYILLGMQQGLVFAGYRCDGNFALGSILGTGQRFAEFVAQVAAATLIGSMLSVATAALVVRCVTLLMSAAVLSRKSPWLSFGFRQAEMKTVRALAAPAISFLGMPLGHALSNQGMVQVLAAVLGPAAVVVFAAHRTICNIASQLVNMLAVAVWPEFSTSFGAGDRTTTRQLHRSACRWSIWLGLSGCAALAIAGPVLIPLWTGGRIQCQMTLFGALLADVVVRIVWWTSSVVPMSTNSHQRMALIYVVCTLGSLVLASVLAPIVGLSGAAAGLLIADLAMVWHVLPASLSAVDDSLRDFVRSLARPPIRLPVAGIGRTV